MATKGEVPPTACIPVLGVRTRMHGDCAILSPHGEIDCASVAVLAEALDGLPEGVGSVVLNMAEVTFMDSAGVHFLHSLRAFGRHRGVLVEAVHFGRQPRHVLELDGSDPLADAIQPSEPMLGPTSALLEGHASSRRLHLVPDSAPESPHPGGGEETAQMRKEIEQLQQALASRPIIDQARGMIMALGPCTSWSAWDLLVEVSQHSNIKLRDVAAALVATTAGQPLREELRHEIELAFQRLPSPEAPDLVSSDAVRSPHRLPSRNADSHDS